MKRKYLIVLLTIVMCACLSCFFACGGSNDTKQDLTATDLVTVAPSTEAEKMFVDNPKLEVLVGSCMDLEDYIIRHDDCINRALQLKFTDKQNTVQLVTVNGATYYPTVSGKYTLIYTEQVKGKILRDSLEITVYAEAPEIKVAAYPLFYSKGQTARLKLLLINANPYCKESNDYVMESVTYYQSNVDLEETVKEGTRTTFNFTNEKEYTFEEYGTYIFTFSVEVDGLKGYGNLRVEVLENNQGNADTFIRDDGTYASSNVQVNGDLVRLVQADYPSASYMVLDEDYYDQDVVRIEFKGKNCPNIGLLTIPNYEVYNPYGIISGKGYTLSLEYSYNDMFSIWGSGLYLGRGEGRFGGMNLHNGNSATGYFGRNNLENGKYYMLETKLDSGSVDEMLTVFYLKIYEIENYGTPEQKYVNVYDAKVPAGTGPENKIEKGKVVFYSSANEDVVFKYYKPVSRVKNFEVNGDVISWDEVPGATKYLVSVNGQAYTEQTETTYTYPNFVKDLTPLYVKPVVDTPFVSGEDGSAKLNWTKTNADGVEVAYSNLLDGPAVFNKYVPAPSESYSGNAFIVNELGGTLTQDIGVTTPHANAALSFNSVDKQAYMVTKDSYAPGSYVAMEFIGNRCPSFILFGVSDIDTGANETVGVGVDMDYSAFAARGYNKVDKDSEPVYYTSANNRLTYGYFKSTNIDRSYSINQEPDFNFASVTKYLLVIGAEQNGANVDVHYNIFAQTGVDSWALYESNVIVVENATLNAGKIAVRSSLRLPGHTCDYKIYTPDTLENINTLIGDLYGLSYFDSEKTFINSGSAVLLNNKGGYDISMSLANPYNYLATRQEYEPGTYFMAEMKTKDIPGMIMFGVDNPTDTIVTKDLETGDGIDNKQNTWNGVGLYTEYVWNPEVYSKKAGSDATYTLAGGKFTTNTDPGSMIGDIGKDNEIVLVMGAYNEGENSKVHYIIYQKDGDVLSKYNEMTYTISGMNVGTGSILFASKHRAGAMPATDIMLWTIGSKTDIETKLNAEYNVKLSVADLFSNRGATITDNNDSTYQINMSLANPYNYAVTNATYAPGTYFMAEMKSKDIPGMVLFGVDNAADNIATKDFATGDGITNKQNTWNGVGIYTEYVWNPEVYSKKADSDAVYTLAGGKFTTNTGSGVASLGDESVVLVMGAYNEGANSKVHYIIYQKAGNVLTKYDEMTYTISGMNVGTGSILFASKHRAGAMPVTDMKLWTIGTKTEVETKLNAEYNVKLSVADLFSNRGATITDNNDGTYQINMSLANPYNYVATKQTYAPGTYFMAEMKSKDIPGMVIFGANNAADTIVTKDFANGDGITNKQNTWNGVGLYTENVWNTEVYSKQAGSDAVYTLVGGKFNTHNTNGVVSLGEQEVVLVMGAYNEGADTKVHYIIYAKDGENLTKYDEMTYTVSGMNVGTGSILFASKHRAGAMPVTDMKLWTVGDKTAVDEKLNSVYTIIGE